MEEAPIYDKPRRVLKAEKEKAAQEERKQAALTQMRVVTEPLRMEPEVIDMLAKSCNSLQLFRQEKLLEIQKELYLPVHQKIQEINTRYLLSVCEKYSRIFSKHMNDENDYQKTNFEPHINKLDDIKRGANPRSKDYNIIEDLKLFEGGTLHPYQLDGVTWLYMLYSNASNGILADEMGLGKTVQVIAFISILLSQQIPGPFLIVAPLSTIPNWKSEFKRFAPKIPVVAITGTRESRKNNMDLVFSKYKVGKIKTYPVVLVTYQTPLLESVSLERHKWKYLIIDEGHRIKNYHCQLGIALRKLRADNKLLLTGTPLQNNVQELWSLLNFILPDIFTDMSTLTELILLEDLKDEEKIIKEEESNNFITKMHKILAPFMLRRLKVDVLQLVPKKEVTVYCPLSPLQLKLYQLVLDKNIEGLKEKEEAEPIDLEQPKKKRKTCIDRDYTYGNLGKLIENSCREVPSSSLDIPDDEHIAGLIVDKTDIKTSREQLRKFHDKVIRLTMQNSLMMFRKIVSHPYLVHFPLDPNSDKPKLLINEDLINCSGKLIVLDTLLPNLQKRGHKVLLFSQLTMTLDLIEEYMIMRNFNYRRLDGSHDLETRATNMQEFNGDPNVFIFLISTRAGGLGINLTGADTVIFFDRDWNPQIDIQAQDRCHRIGQNKPVVIYTLTAKNTIDERVIDTSHVKRMLEKVVIIKGKFKTISKEDKSKTEDLLTYLRNALKRPEEDCYIFSNTVELEKMLDRSDLYEQMNQERKGEESR